MMIIMQREKHHSSGPFAKSFSFLDIDVYLNFPSRHYNERNRNRIVQTSFITHDSITNICFNRTIACYT